MTVAASIVGVVLVSGTSFVATVSKTASRASARAATVEQANQFADILERMASRSISYWGNTTWNGESNLILFCLPDGEIKSATNQTDPALAVDPNGNSWLWGAKRYVVYWSGPTGAMGDSSDAMPMLAEVTLSPVTVQPLPAGFVDGSGKSLFPAVSGFTLGCSFDQGLVTITVTARTDVPSMGTQRGIDSPEKEQITVRRVVRRPR